jgi:hypothetical protein
MKFSFFSFVSLTLIHFLHLFLLLFGSSSSFSPNYCIFRDSDYDCRDRDRPHFPSSLPIFQPLIFLEIFENMTIHVIGDSVSAQHYKSLVCELSSYASPPLQIQMTNLNVTDGEVRYIPSWACLTFQRNLSLCWANDVTNHGEIFHKSFEPDLLIWNAAGLHSHSESFHLQKLHRVIFYARKHQYYPFHENSFGTNTNTITNAKTNTNLTSMTTTMSSNTRIPIHHLLLYRETTPQSFVGSLTGDYDQRNLTITKCQNILSSLQSNENLIKSQQHHHLHHQQQQQQQQIMIPEEYLTYRQKLERELFKKRGIPFLPIHDLTLLRGGSQYVGFPDCTHFCDPGTPILWNRMLYEFVTTSPLIKSLREGKNIQQQQSSSNNRNR